VAGWAQGNWIGTNGDGLGDIWEGNVISGNGGQGVQISGIATDNNIVAGNLVGTNLQGTHAVPNAEQGILITDDAKQNIIGTNGDGVSDALKRNIISGNGVQGVLIYRSAARNVVAGNLIGTDVTGNVALGNGRHGIELHSGASSNTIGTNGDGLGDIWEGNVISGNRALGVRISGIATDNNIVAGNLVGTNLQGTHAVANAEQGILITGAAKRNVIGTNGDGISDAEERNLVSGNGWDGIGIAGSGTDGNVVAGNLVGTDSSGAAAIANGRHGISIWAGAKSNRAGTNGDGISDAWERNLVSGNTWSGINLQGAGTDGNVVSGNFVGTDATSQVPLPNRQSGVRVAGWAQGNWIGTNGDSQGGVVEGNVISGNVLYGVLLSGQGTDRNRVAGNLIGTAVSGLTAVPNGSQGVRIETGASDNVIGTNGDGVSDSLEGNTISGNGGMGIMVRDPGTDGNIIAGNVIGLDRTGKIAVPNQWHGIKVESGAQYTRIGTNGDGISDREEANIISANANNGILFQFEGTSNNRVAGNFIGTDASGTMALGNNRNGIEAADGAHQNILGGSGSLANTIAFNASSGVQLSVSSSHGVSIQGNSIYLNGGLGIDLGSDGPTWNDPGDVDLGPNHFQNYPVLSTVTPGTTTRISGMLDSLPLTSFTLDFYANTELDPSGFGEGERYLGGATVTTDADGLAVFHVALAAATEPGEFITATATAPDGSTSEFSRGVAADGLPDLRIDSRGIVVSPVHPAAGEAVAIVATIVNQGLADAASVLVRFYDLDALIDEVTIPAIAAGSAALATVETSFPNDSYRLITVLVDPLNTILELDEGNNQASTILQVGLPSTEDATLGIEMGTFSGCAGRGVLIHGSAFYDFEQLPGERDFPVQGGRVTVSLADPGTGQVLTRFTGAHTDVSGDFRQGILAPQEAGLYTIIAEVTDGTIQAVYASTLSVSACPTIPPITPPTLPAFPPGDPGNSPPSETLTDVFIVSEGIVFSHDNPELGEEISLFGFVQYIGPDAVENVPITIVTRFPVGGQLREFPIASTVVDFPASPATATYVVVEAAWTGTARGDHVIQVAAQPPFPQNTSNDAATRIIVVGSAADALAFVKTVELLVDADGDSRPSAGDTLRYILTYDNVGSAAVTNARIIDDYDQRFVLTPAEITHGGSADGDLIAWDLGTIEAGAAGAVAYEVTLKPSSQFPGGLSTVVNTAYLDADQTSPVVAMVQIGVWGDVTPPVATATVTPSANTAGWNNTDVGAIPKNGDVWRRLIG
jgi:titin